MALYKHIFLTGNVNSEKYRAPTSRGANPRIPVRDRAIQSEKLLQQFDAIWQQKAQFHQLREAEQITTREGTYLSFTSAAEHDLITKSLEDLKKGIRLLNIKEVTVGNNQTQIRATVYVPNGKEGHFISKIQKYQQEETQNGIPKNAPLVNSIEDVRIAFLESLWTDNPQLIPANNPKWCEVWLNVNTKENQEREQISLFLNTLEAIGINVKQTNGQASIIIFPERAILLIDANREQLIELILRSDLLAEFRAGQEPAGFWVNESKVEQQAWVNDLLNRVQLIESKVKVCLLDTGVNNGHPLLQQLLDNSNMLTVDNSWGTDDHYPEAAGHGTLMAGVGGYGKMEQLLISENLVPLTHNLCSVKILPRPNQGQTREELWGDITARGVYIAEIQNPEMDFIYCMSVTSTRGVNKGRPSSWSGALDNLAFGNGENQRIIIISAGNMMNHYQSLNELIDYPTLNYNTSVQNPSQSWNSITIGAFTEKILVNDDRFANYSPLANKGELSPHSTTSQLWEKKWPVKPDLVFEGGNLLVAPDSIITNHDDLDLLSTSKSFNSKPFDIVNATSAAAAQASWFAAKIAYDYPNAWPETIKGLMIHSANWNSAMLAQINVIPGNRGSYRDLLRTFGYGVPNLDRSLYSQESAMTLITQEVIKPFSFNEGTNTPKTNEIHFFNLPWPVDLLLDMGEIPVKLKITLSYFIEPGPGEIGWKVKYRYQSHGLRFEINNVNESEDDFRKRVNIAAREENEEVNGNAGSERWAIGSKNPNRTTGSIHSDYWEGTAADLATCHHISVYPVIGWWRERKHLGKVENQTRYSLIISLETPSQEVDLYTTVKNLIQIPIEIQTS